MKIFDIIYQWSKSKVRKAESITKLLFEIEQRVFCKLWPVKTVVKRLNFETFLQLRLKLSYRYFLNREMLTGMVDVSKVKPSQFSNIPAMYFVGLLCSFDYYNWNQTYSAVIKKWNIRL